MSDIGQLASSMSSLGLEVEEVSRNNFDLASLDEALPDSARQPGLGPDRKQGGRKTGRMMMKIWKSTEISSHITAQYLDSVIGKCKSVKFTASHASTFRDQNNSLILKDSEVSSKDMITLKVKCRVGNNVKLKVKIGKMTKMQKMMGIVGRVLDCRKEQLVFYLPGHRKVQVRWRRKKA